MAGYNDKDICCLDNVFEAIFELVRGPKRLTRIIFLYSRYMTDVGLSTCQYFNRLMSNDELFIDVIYIFVKPNGDEETTRMNHIYQSLVKLARRGQLISCWYTCKRLNESLMKLLAHPFQRNELNDSSDFSIHEEFKGGRGARRKEFTRMWIRIFLFIKINF